MHERFDAKHLKHVDGYDEKIGIDKAHAMAEDEDKMRAFAKQYGEYVATGTVPESGLGVAFNAKYFGALKAAGITPEYLREADEVLGVEVPSAVRDFIEKAKAMTPEERVAEAQRLQSEIDGLRAAPNAPREFKQIENPRMFYGTGHLNKILDIFLRESKFEALQDLS